jgi:hypothetical protein
MDGTCSTHRMLSEKLKLRDHLGNLGGRITNGCQKNEYELNSAGSG